jgi:hypothetical protein
MLWTLIVFVAVIGLSLVAERKRWRRTAMVLDILAPLF